MDKSDEFFEANYGEPVDPAVQSILVRLRNVAACFRQAFPETQMLLNQTGNASAWNYESGYSDEQSGDSILHTVIILSIFCSVVLLLVVRSSRGGSWTSCKADVAAVSAARKEGAARKSLPPTRLSELESFKIERVPSWTQERPNFGSSIRVMTETDF